MTPGRVAEPVGHQSISRTLLAAATGEDCGSCFGSDLRTTTGDAVVEGMLPPDLSYRVRDGYIAFRDQATGAVKLFDLRRDPQLATDLHAERPDVAASLTSGLRADPLLPYHGYYDRLRGLGYIDGQPAKPR